jgi:hypothetical protein
MEKKEIVKKSRAPRGSKQKDPSKLYFHKGTQAAIVAYQQVVDNQKEREKIYVTDILPAFTRLVENLINVYKFASLHDSFDDLKHDCVNFLFESIGKFDNTRGTNAFSYFNVVAKNFLIVRTKQKAQRIKRSISMDDVRALNTHECSIVEENSTIPAQDLVYENATITHNIIKMLYEIRSKMRTDNELVCINSIITIFEHIDDIDILTRSAIHLYIREMSGLSPKQLLTSMQAIKKHYKKMKLDMGPDLF